MNFQKFLSTLTDLELVGVIHSLRKDVNDAPALREALEELKAREARRRGAA
jgi:hypothetical protein